MQDLGGPFTFAGVLVVDCWKRAQVAVSVQRTFLFFGALKQWI